MVVMTVAGVGYLLLAIFVFDDYSKNSDGNSGRVAEKQLADVETVQEADSVAVKSKIQVPAVFIDLGLPSGTKWAECNIGASSEWEFGNYCTTTEADTYYVPSQIQAEELMAQCEWTWVEDSGYKITGPNGNSICLPAAGFCDNSGKLYGSKEFGAYWIDNSGHDSRTSHNTANRTSHYALHYAPRPLHYASIGSGLAKHLMHSATRTVERHIQQPTTRTERGSSAMINRINKFKRVYYLGFKEDTCGVVFIQKRSQRKMPVRLVSN